jgi:hypothetical protein
MLYNEASSTVVNGRCIESFGNAGLETAKFAIDYDGALVFIGLSTCSICDDGATQYDGSLTSTPSWERLASEGLLADDISCITLVYNACEERMSKTTREIKREPTNEIKSPL